MATTRDLASTPDEIWICPPTAAEQSGLPLLVHGMSRTLVARIVHRFSSPTDTVLVTGLDSTRIAAVVAAHGPRRAIVEQRSDLAPIPLHSIGLVLAIELPIPWASPDGEPYRTWRSLLREDGVLAVATVDLSEVQRTKEHVLTEAAALAAGFERQPRVTAVVRDTADRFSIATNLSIFHCGPAVRFADSVT